MKKLLVLVFAIALCLGVLCVGASASGAEPPQVAGVYQLDSDDDLYWFAEQVNGGEYGANAVLTADITINENVLDDAGNVNSNSASSFTQWTPICGKKIRDYVYTEYTGTFDGDGHTISGLYYDDSGDYAGLFGFVGSNGRVQNVKVADSYIGNNYRDGFTGGVCGYNNGGTITNCYNTGTVKGLYYTGGVCGDNGGMITNCSFSGSVTCNNIYTFVGGVCGSNVGTIENSYNAGTVTSVGSSTCLGGVCGYNPNGSTIRNCYNTGAVNGEKTVNGYFYAGGVCGNNDSYTLQSTITNCYNTGSVTVSGSGTNYVGGVCGSNDSFSSSQSTITNCYNTGSVTGSENVGGVCGYNGDYSTIDNCYNTGDVTGSNNGSGSLCVGGVCGYNDGTITNCYWREDTGLNGCGIDEGTVTDVEYKTAEEFASGEVTWLLNRYQENGPWRQTLSEGNDNYPTLDSTQEIVFQVMLDETDYYCNGSFTIPASPSRPGYTFVGWSDGNKTYEAGDGVTIPTTEPNGTVTLYAQWTANEYTVQFDPNDGEGEMTDQDFTYDETKSLTTNIFTHTGYTFDEWNTAADGTGTSYEDGQQVSNLTTEPNGTVTLYAQWKANSYSVSLNLNNGKFVEGYQGITSYTYGTTTLLPDAEQVTRSGYRFEGWYADEKFQDGPYTQISAADLGNKTFYARWSFINIPDPNGITVTQPANGTIRVNPSNGSAGTLITVTATPDEGYELAYITVDGEKITGNTFKMPDKAVTVSAVFVPVTFPFTDVKSGDWFYDAVAYVYANGLMDGVSGTTFEPNANMTRAMVWAILARIDGETVTGAAWATDARAWAMAEGVSDGTDPNGLVTREQFATMLYRYAVAKGYDVSIGESTNILSYADFGQISEYAIPAMQWACGSGIVTGVTDSTLAPQGTATRAQCAAMLMRFVEL